MQYWKWVSTLALVGPLAGCGDSTTTSSGGEQPSCGSTCSANYECGTQAEATCGDPLNSTSCTSDSTCPTGNYCHACESGASLCAPTCTSAAGCNAWETCAAGHCAALACTSDANCPANFACTSEKTCARKSCEADSECAGYCVLHACQAEPGYCVCKGC